MVYLSQPMIDSTADAVIIPVSGTDEVAEGSVHETFLTLLDPRYLDHYRRQVKMRTWDYTAATTMFVHEGLWKDRWIVEVPVQPKDGFVDLSPRINRAMYLVERLEAKTLSVCHLPCMIHRAGQEVLWQHVEGKLKNVELYLHTQEWDEADEVGQERIPLIVEATSA